MTGDALVYAFSRPITEVAVSEQHQCWLVVYCFIVSKHACLTLSSALASLYGDPATAEAPARPAQPDHDSFLSRRAAWARSAGNSSGKSSLAIQRRAGPVNRGSARTSPNSACG